MLRNESTRIKEKKTLAKDYSYRDSRTSQRKTKSKGRNSNKAARRKRRSRVWLNSFVAVVVLNFAVVIYHGDPRVQFLKAAEAATLSSTNTTKKRTAEKSTAEKISAKPLASEDVVSEEIVFVAGDELIGSNGEELDGPPSFLAETYDALAGIRSPQGYTSVVKAVVKRNQTPAGTLYDAGLGQSDVIGIIKSLEPYVDFRRIRPVNISSEENHAPNFSVPHPLRNMGINFSPAKANHHELSDLLLKAHLAKNTFNFFCGGAWCKRNRFWGGRRTSNSFGRQCVEKKKESNDGYPKKLGPPSRTVSHPRVFLTTSGRHTTFSILKAATPQGMSASLSPIPSSYSAPLSSTRKPQNRLGTSHEIVVKTR